MLESKAEVRMPHPHQPCVAIMLSALSTSADFCHQDLHLLPKHRAEQPAEQKTYWEVLSVSACVVDRNGSNRGRGPRVTAGLGHCKWVASELALERGKMDHTSKAASQLKYGMASTSR